MSKSPTTISLAFLAALTLAAPTLAIAQAGDDSADFEADDSVEEIIVTARKTEESLQEIPGSITAVNSSMIEDLQLETVDDIAKLVPGFSFSKAFGRATERPVVRGLSNVLAGVQFGVEAGAAYFVDGIYYPGSAQSLDAYTLDRVEVVRGPQSALYGRNTYSGAINFVTKNVSDTRSAYLRVSAGDYGTSILSAGADLPVNDALGVRLSFRDYSYDGEWTNLVTGQTVGDESSTSFSATLNYRTDNSNLKARLQNDSIADGTRPFFLQPASENNCYPAAAGNALSRGSELTPGTFLYYCGAIQTRPIALNDGPFAGTKAELATLSEELGYPASLKFFPGYGTEAGLPFSGVEIDQTLISVLYETQFASNMSLSVSFANRTEELRTGSDSDHSPVNGTFSGLVPGPTTGASSTIGVAGTDDFSDYSLEAVLYSDPEKDLRWSAGVYLYNQQRDDINIGFPGFANDGRKTDEGSTANTSFFGSLSVDLNDNLTLDFEARSQSETKEATALNADGTPALEQDGTWDDFLPRVSVTYKADPSTTYYGIFAQGSKPGGFNGTSGEAAGIPEYEQENNTTIEGGWKKIWSDKVRTTLAVYNSDITNIQGTEPVPNSTGARTSIAKNSGDGSVFGIEFELHYIINDNWDLNFTYSLASTEYGSGCDETQFQLTSGGGNYFNWINLGADATDAQKAAANPNGNGDCSIAGNQFAFSPESSYSAVAGFNYPLGNSSWRLAGAVDMTFEDKKYAQVHNGAYTDAVTLLGMRIGARNDRYSIMLTGRNITDEDSPVLVTRWVSPVFSTAPRWYFANPRPGANFGLEFSAKF